ncbi:MAG: ABC-F family ATP-binding cassette domain-containing protein [Coriobacteriales bacterium]|nr:ABC-F family ATP-binding cassette domain-containing protein [Coriobacteriales bacterium]
MGILIGAERISFEWPGKRVLRDQTLGVYEGDRIGIVGQNGDGKSTLLDLLGQVLEPDGGSITYRGGIAVGMLGQGDRLREDDTLEQAVVGDMPTYEWAADPRVRSIIAELVGDLDWNGRVGDLSGGQRRRADLARLLVGRWDVLLLDEPTNHLDLHAIRWLARHLRDRWPQGAGALLVVTHDRWFLDEVCEHMWEVHDERVEPFEGGYSAYIQQRVERNRVAAVMEERRQNMLRKELNWLAHGAKARTSKPKFRIDAAMALIENDPPLRNTVELHRMAMSRLGKQVIEMRDIAVSYPASQDQVGAEASAEAVPVLDGISWIIGPGDRVGILGENGAGKSTLLRVMCGRQRPARGWVKIGKTVRFGWLGQRLERLSAHDDWRVQELLGRFKRYYNVDGKPQSPEQMAERLGFTRKDFMTYVGALSGGQRRRLALLCVLMEEPNVLVLDEPGNDLDTDMLAVVEDLLDTWPGTLIMVSHDRSLLERVTDDQFSLIGGKLLHCPGGVDEYLDRLDAARSSQDEASLGQASPKQVSQRPEGSAPQKSPSNAERRELKKRFDAVERRMGKTEAELGRLQDELARVNPTDFEALLSKQAEVDSCSELLEDLETEWLELSDLLGNRG